MAALVRRGAAALRSAGLSARRLVEPPGALGVGSGQFCAAARRPPRAAGAVQMLVRGWATDADRHAVRAAVERSATPLWLSNYTPTPPVQAAPDSQAPTAMAWLYRRGPELSRGAIHKLFRKRQVRALDAAGVGVRRVKPEETLRTGERLFVPRAAVLAYVDAAAGEGGERSAREAPPRARRERSNAASRTGQRVPAPRSRQPSQPASFRPKDTVLLAERDLVVVNKPPGLPMTAPPGAASVESAYRPTALGLRASAFLSPAHELLNAASGALILAKSEALHGLYAAHFGRKAQAPVQPDSTVPHLRPREVKQMWWALLDASGVDVATMRRSFPIVMEYRTEQATVTAGAQCRVKAVHEGLMWVELRPMSNINVQLRPMCARILKCPIIGDRKHGPGPEGAGAAAAATVSQLLRGSGGAKGGAGELPLFLHARSLVVRYARGVPPLAVTAPLPKHMAALWDTLGWDHAVVNYRQRAPLDAAATP